MSDTAFSLPALLALGAGHGINPAMGWLFAVALGLQRGRRGAVWAALGPLAVGHALAIAAAILAAGVVGVIVPLEVLKWGTALLLVGLGVSRLVRSRHPSLGSGRAYGGMQVDGRELAIWSFLMASSHGAGLMVLPLILGDPSSAVQTQHVVHASLISLGGPQWNRVVAALVHTTGYLLVTGLIAVIVYERLGVRFLRTAWINLDLIWAIALIGTGLGTVLL
jgi:threonine/homoserine/homoserine lactone efflux protein